MGKSMLRNSIIFFIFLYSSFLSASDFYPDNYLQSRQKFRQVSKKLQLDFPEVRFGSYNVPSKIDGDLTTDYIIIPALKKTKKLMILTSGVHGVEASLCYVVRKKRIGGWRRLRCFYHLLWRGRREGDRTSEPRGREGL